MINYLDFVIRLREFFKMLWTGKRCFWCRQRIFFLQKDFFIIFIINMFSHTLWLSITVALNLWEQIDIDWEGNECNSSFTIINRYHLPCGTCLQIPPPPLLLVCRILLLSVLAILRLLLLCSVSANNKRGATILVAGTGNSGLQSDNRQRG